MDWVTIKLRASLRKDYGRIVMEFGAEADFQITPTFSVRDGYASLYAEINEQFKDYEANVLARERFDNPANNPSGGTIQLTGISAVKSQNGGKVTYAIQTAERQYAKYGVALYELIDNYPVLKKLLDEKGKYQFKENVSIVVDISGNHPRIVEVKGKLA